MQEVHAIFAIFGFDYFSWILVLCFVMSTIFWYSTDLVKEICTARFLFFSYVCKLNLFTFHSMYKFFIVKTGEEEKFRSKNDAERFGIFFISKKFIYLLVYFVTFRINPCIKSITLNILTICSNRLISNFTGKFYYHFFKC